MKKTYTADFKAKVLLEILKEEKTLTQLSSEYEVSVAQLSRWKTMALSNLPRLLDAEDKKVQEARLAQQKKEDELYQEIGRLTTQLKWLKKNLASSIPMDERLSMLEPDNKELSLSKQTELLSLNRTSLYYKPVEPSDEEIAIKHRIDEVYTKHPYFGYRRITAELNRAGMNVNHKRIQRYMQEMGIKGICPGPNLSKRNIADVMYPYLLNGLVIDHPDHVWSIDITYIRLRHGWMYLTAVMDWFSRYVLSWELSQTLEMPFVLEAVKQALLIGKPEIFNSDQGSHFTSPQYTQLLLDSGIKISMDSKGRALDNIFIERLWRSLKYEEVYINDYETPRDARSGISEYLGFYNNERPHQSLRYLTPSEVYYQMHEKAAV